MRVCLEDTAARASMKRLSVIGQRRAGTVVALIMMLEQPLADEMDFKPLLRSPCSQASWFFVNSPTPLLNISLRPFRSCFVSDKDVKAVGTSKPD